MPVEGADGLQVISPVDPKLAMNDDDLKILQYIAQHLVILDLTNSQVTDEGLAVLQKFPNLKKLILEGSEKITIQGIQNISMMPSLELLNLIRLKLDDSVVDILSKMGGLQQVFLYQTGLFAPLFFFSENRFGRFGIPTQSNYGHCNVPGRNK
jgi:hypothetical protein